MTPSPIPSSSSTQTAPHLQPLPTGRFPLWRFWVPLAVQLALVLAVPAPKALTLATGETVFLDTVPVDPYDLLRGRYVTLRYSIQAISDLRNLPGGEGWNDKTWNEVFITLAPPKESTVPTAPWQPVAVADRYPASVEPGHLVIRGEPNRRNWIDLGLGEYYIPEEIGDQLEADINTHPEETRAEVKVDPWGRAALVNVWVQDRQY